MWRFVYIPILIGLALVAASPPLLVTTLYYSSGLYRGVQTAFYDLIDPPTPFQEIRFTGDIMLARHVETLMRSNGATYPFSRLATSSDMLWVGNFEATVPDEHTQTPDFTFTFSVDKTFLEPLSDFGFTHLSVANNHTYDYGETGYTETLKNLEAFTTFGHPNTVSAEQVVYLESGEIVIGLLGLNLTPGEFDALSTQRVLASMADESDIQIVYVHWGEEYRDTHTEFQARVAEQLIDDGADAIIGHHPHVVQDIGLYNGAPIFYSLGNFIFDQYFDQAVMEGLVVGLTQTDLGFAFMLYPTTYADAPASPRYLDEIERTVFLEQLAERSDSVLQAEIRRGYIEFEH